MRILITNKENFDRLLSNSGINKWNVEEQDDIFFISINNPRDKQEPYLENAENAIVLFFDDVDKDFEVPDIKTREKLLLKAFTKEQAQQLFYFVTKHKDKENCVIHCEAGVSRSGAVGKFICDYLRLDQLQFMQQNPYINPNTHVLRLLRNAHRDHSLSLIEI